MQLTRPGTLAAVFVVCAVVAWLATRATFQNLPLLPLSAIPALAALAIAETAVGRHIRRRLTGGRPETKPIAPIAVARLVALAKASSLGGSALGGLAGGYLIFVLGSLDKTIPARDARVAGLTVAAAIALIAAALYLERCCRAPKPPDDDDDDSRRRSSDTWQWHS
jgi:hypothetical protein